MSKITIKRCPFPHENNEELDFYFESNVVSGRHVYCLVCKAQGPSGRTESEAIEKWNSRV